VPRPGSGVQPWRPSRRVRSTGDALAVGAGGVWCFDPARDRAFTRFNPQTGQVDVAMRPDQGTGGTAPTTSGAVPPWPSERGAFFGFFRVFGFFRPPRFLFFSGDGLGGGLAFISWSCGRVTRTPGLVRVASSGSTRCRLIGASGIRVPRRRGRVGRLGSDAAATEPTPPGDHFASGSRGPRRFPPAVA